jgi:hypothetical protein
MRIKSAFGSIEWQGTTPGRCKNQVEKRQNCIALGPSGTGKTHTALGLALAACQKGYSVAFTTMRIKSAFGSIEWQGTTPGRCKNQEFCSTHKVI